MKRSILTLLGIVALGCGAGEPSSQAAQEPTAADVERSLAGEVEVDSEHACEVLGSGVLAEVFAVSDDAWSYRPASKYVPQALCTATGKSPDGATSYEVALMIMKAEFDSPDAAVASLESTVETLSAGKTIEVGGKEHTTKVDFEPFIDDVGDLAAWAPKLNELSVADRGVRFAVTVTGVGGSDENKAKAIELARLVGNAL